MNIFNLKVVGLTFDGYVHIDDVPESILDFVQSDDKHNVQIQGTFEVVSWYDQYPVLAVTELMIEDKDVVPLLSEDSLEQIAEDLVEIAGYDLWIDREAVAADMIYDSMKENGD